MVPLSLLILFLCPSLRATPEPLTVAVGGSRVLTLAGVERAALADGRVARVRVVPPNQLLLTGIKAGVSSLTVWVRGEQRAFEVQVAPRRLFDSALGSGPAPVVKVELEFLELDRTETAKWGIRWPDTLEGSLSATARTDGNSFSSSLGASLASSRGVLEQLTTDGKAKILAQPRLRVRLGEEVKFHSGGEFPVNTSVEQGGRVYPRVEWKPYGLTVQLRPESLDGVHFSAEVEVEISETDPSLVVEGVPALTKRKLATKMESKEGETVFLSGLVRRIGAKGREGVPLLGEIPLLGIFFARSRSSEVGTEVLLAMTLSLGSRSGAARELDEARERMSEAVP